MPPALACDTLGGQLRISVITAVKSGMADHLGALYGSLQSQAMPPTWEWQWVLQEDGETGEPASMVPRDRRISTGMAPWRGAARARTLALSRADGDLVRAVDGLPPDGSWALLCVFESLRVRFLWLCSARSRFARGSPSPRGRSPLRV